MTGLRTSLIWALRLTGLIQVVLGLLFWSGRGLDLVNIHMSIGLAFTLAYLGLVTIAARAGGGVRTALAVAFGLFIPVFGMIHTRLLLGEWHYLIRAAHLLSGIAAMAVANRMTKRAAEAQRPGAGAAAMA